MFFHQSFSGWLFSRAIPSFLGAVCVCRFMASLLNFEAIWNALPEAIGILDAASMKIVFANKAFQVWICV
jgi:hypothetical protein